MGLGYVEGSALNSRVIESTKYKSRNFIHSDQRPPYKMQSYIFCVVDKPTMVQQTCKERDLE